MEIENRKELDYTAKKESSFNVTLEEFDDLSNEEKQCVSNEGNGKYRANYIRINHNGKQFFWSPMQLS